MPVVGVSLPGRRRRKTECTECLAAELSVFS